jgi:hypothetical protein
MLESAASPAGVAAALLQTFGQRGCQKIEYRADASGMAQVFMGQQPKIEAERVGQLGKANQVGFLVGDGAGQYREPKAGLGQPHSAGNRVRTDDRSHAGQELLEAAGRAASKSGAP